MGDKTDLVRTRSLFKSSKETLMGLVSLMEPTSVDDISNGWVRDEEAESRVAAKISGAIDSGETTYSATSNKVDDDCEAFL